MAALVVVCALLGAFFLLPLLPTLIFVLLTIYGALKLLETWLTPRKPRRVPPTPPKP